MKGWPGEPDMEHDVLVAQGPAADADGKPISNVIFDFGNVLIYWDPSVVLLPRYSQETIDQFLDNDISGFYDANDRMDGGASPDEGVAWMREHYGDKWADILRYYLDNFEDSLTGVVPGARVLVNDLKAAGIGVWGLSNWEKELFPIALKHCEILQRLDDRSGAGDSGHPWPRRPSGVGVRAHAQAAQGHLREGLGGVRHQRRKQRIHRRQGDEHRGRERGRHPRHSLLGRPQAARAADRAGHRYPGGSVTSARPHVVRRSTMMTGQMA